MEIRKNRWHAKLYNIAYKRLDQSLCTYFWKLVLALVLLPFTFIWYLIPCTRNNEGLSGYIFCSLVTTFFIIIGRTIGSDIFGDFSFVSGLVGFVLTVVGSALIVGILILIAYLLHLAGETKRETLIGERFKGFKNKYCPRIEWK